MAGITTTRKANVFAVGSLDLIENKAKAKELIQEESKRYSGGFEGPNPKRAIPLREETKYPQLASAVGASFSDPFWTEKVKNFWAEFSYRIPYGVVNEYGAIEGGIELDASFTTDGDKIYCENFEQFILFEMMQKDREVCLNPELWNERRSYGFFCIDKTKETQRAKELTKLKQDAVIELAKLLQDQEVESRKGFFRVLAGAIDPEITALYAKTMSYDDVIRTIITASEKYPKAFLEAAKDDTLMKRAFIREAVEAGAVTKVGNKYVFENEEFGSETEFISFLSNPANAEYRQKIKTKIEEFSVIGI